MKLKLFQREDLARLALHPGAILGWQQGLGKTLAAFLYPALKCGFERYESTTNTLLAPDAIALSASDGEREGERCRSAPASQNPKSEIPNPKSLRPLAPVLIIAPGDLHDRYARDGAKLFGADLTPLDSQQTFTRLARSNHPDGRPNLPPGYYLTTYTQLALNGVPKPLDADAWEPSALLAHLCLKLTGDDSPEQLFLDRATVWRVEYATLDLTPASSPNDLALAYETRCRRLASWQNQAAARKQLQLLRHAYDVLANLVTNHESPTFNDLSDPQRKFIIREFCRRKLEEFAQGEGEIRDYPIVEAATNQCGQHDTQSPSPLGEREGERWARPSSTDHCPRAPRPIRCVGYPRLVDLCWNAFDCVVVDEGTRIKSEDSIIGAGVRSMQPAYRLVMTGTPIKNRLPDLFHLILWAVAANHTPSPRFPYTTAEGQQQEFAETFLVSERNLTREEDKGRRFQKLTPEICNLHLLWKLITPCMLRRRKADTGEQIVKLLPQSIRVPLGRQQAEVYQTHLHAPYLDKHDLPAIGAKLQALRLVTAAPASLTLNAPVRAGDAPKPSRSQYPFTPKLLAVLSIIEQALRRKEQILVFSVFNEPLDVLSRYLLQACVQHKVLDGRTTPAKRGGISAVFERGRPAGAGASFPVLLAGEAMAEGHSYPLCNNVVIFCESWALDKTLQMIERAWRINSVKDLHLWNILCDGTIDERIESMRKDKGDSADLALDGKLIGQRPAEVNLAQLLNAAFTEFEKGVKTVDEAALLEQWPALRLRLETAMSTWWQDEEMDVAIPCSTSSQASTAASPIPAFATIAPLPKAVPSDRWRDRLQRRRAA
jgi:hypothetical protein